MTNLADTYGSKAGQTPNQVNENKVNAAKKLFGGGQKSPEEGSSSAPAENNSEKSEKKLDNDEKNSYIEPNSQQEPASSVDSSEDSETAKYREFVKNTWGVDNPSEQMLNTAKSYVNLQSKYTKTAQERKQYEQIVSQLDNLIQKQPKLKSILERAVAGEDIENLLSGSDGTVQDRQSSTPTNDAKQLKDSTDFDVSDKTLIDGGYLDPNKRDYLSSTEWETEKLRAMQKYIMKSAAEEAAKASETAFERKQREYQEQMERQQLEQTQKQRYNTGFNKAVQRGWDFAGEHEDILEEVNNEIKSFRDPRDTRLIREDAFDIALELVAKRRGIQPKGSTKPKLSVQNMDFQPKVTPNKQEPDNTPKDPFSKRLYNFREKAQKRNQDYMSSWSKRE